MRRATRLGFFLLALTAACERTREDPSGDLLREAWASYKRIYITSDGRVVDRDRGGGHTTSEGQGYAMLRAAWMRDGETFMRTFEWTERHLKRADGLYSWLWAPDAPGLAEDRRPGLADDRMPGLADDRGPGLGRQDPAYMRQDRKPGLGRQDPAYMGQDRMPGLGRQDPGYMGQDRMPGLAPQDPASIRQGRVVDPNTATDADQEIALALVIGSHVFGDRRLLVRARELVRAIRQHERIDVGDGWFPAAGNWAVAARIVNLSYFLPYAYPYFARIDPDGRWDAVTDTGYDLLRRTAQTPSTRLIPDFMTVTLDGQPGPLPPDTGLSSEFSSDALRIYWRVAVDCRLHKRTRACADPLGAAFLRNMLDRDGALFTKYSRDGIPLERIESSSFYGAALPFLNIHAPAAGASLRSRHLSDAAVRNVLNGENRYFDANWVWFGLAAADGVIESATPSVNAISNDSARP